MITDSQGHVLTGASDKASTAYGEAVRAFQLYRGDPLALLDWATEDSPDFAMAYLVKAYLLALATEPAATGEARALLAQVGSMRLNEREASLAGALGALIDGEWTAASVALDHHNLAYPLDILALQAGHLTDFYRASARNLRDRVARVLPRWSADLPGYSIVLGMYSFGLEECGDYVRAEAMGRRALAMQPLDCWAHHAVTHVMEMQGRSEDGIGWMMARKAHWTGDDNFFQVHNWWHWALFHMDLGQVGEALALYDGPVRGARSGVVLDLIDASALLWRLHLSGCDVGTRWEELAQAWDAHADGQLYPFNDWHAVMAYLGANREADVGRLVDAHRSGGPAETGRWARETGLALIEGFAAFWHGQYERAAHCLYGARAIANTFGGSHAQRDVIDWTLIEAALRAERLELAQGLAAERLALKPHSKLNLGYLARARPAGIAPSEARTAVRQGNGGRAREMANT